MKICDVLVVGGGAAGLSAALSARAEGADVVLVEKQSRLGGSTAMSIGSFTAAGTRWQRAKGVSDDIDSFVEDMLKFPGVDPQNDNLELRRVLAEGAAPALAWLDRLGVPFVATFPEPPHRVERMHNVVPDSRMYIDVLEQHARQNGVQILVNVATSELVFNEQHEAVGIMASADGKPLEIRARRGVVIATGDFTGNADMRRQYLSPAASASIPANPNASGDGHRMALRAGALLKAMDYTSGPKLRFVPGKSSGLLAMLPRWRWLMRFLAAVASRLPRGALRPFVKSLLVVHMQPAQGLFTAGSILIDVQGNRFSDETNPSKDLALRPRATGYIVFDQTIRARFLGGSNYVSTAPGVGYAYMSDYERARPDLFVRGNTPAELAKALNMDVASLTAALASSSLRAPYTVMGPVVSSVTTSEGGIAVDRSCAVLREDGTTFSRLFASGATAQSGMRLSGHGLHIAWAVVSGRIAGAAAARLPAHEEA